MNTSFDCIPCFVRQALESARLVTDDEAVHERVLRETLAAAAALDLRQSPPAMAQHFHRVIRECTGRDNPYREIKQRYNEMALELYPKLESWVAESARPMETAVRLAIAGNIIDLGAKTSLAEAEICETIAGALHVPLDGDLEGFTAAVRGAQHILYLADNAGEIVFDRLLIEQLQPAKVTVAVRGAPIINDATRADAKVARIDEVAEVIDNGSDAPGTILEDCSSDFRRRFAEAQLIISKGQGNYETLSDVDQNIYFLLKAKCPVIARHIGCQEGAMLIRRAASSGGTGGNHDDREAACSN